MDRTAAQSDGTDPKFEDRVRMYETIKKDQYGIFSTSCINGITLHSLPNGICTFSGEYNLEEGKKYGTELLGFPFRVVENRSNRVVILRDKGKRK